MLALLSLITVLADGSARAMPCDVEKLAQVEEMQVLEDARRDFELRLQELGLSGSAPLLGLEAASLETKAAGAAEPATDSASKPVEMPSSRRSFSRLLARF